jgi:hypothetical protein
MITKGLKAEVFGSFLPATQAKGAKVNLHFKQANFHGRASWLVHLLDMTFRKRPLPTILRPLDTRLLNTLLPSPLLTT